MANWAIVIGINRYSWAPTASLKGAIPDALRFMGWLQDPNGGNVPDHNLFLLLAPSDETQLPSELNSMYDPASKKMIMKNIERVVEKSGGEGDKLFFYYAGHGLAARVNFADEDALIPSDFDNLDVRAITLRSILEYFQGTQFREQFFFVDACRNTPWVDEIVPDRLNPKQRDPSEQAVDQFVIQSTSPGVKAGELNEAGNERGAFTELLLAGLRGEGHAKTMDIESGEYRVSMNRLFKFVADGIRGKQITVHNENARQLFQTPRLSGEHAANDPILAHFPAGSFPKSEDTLIESAVLGKVLSMDPYGILYAVFRVNKTNVEETLQRLEIAINTQDRLGNKEIPFVSPKEFNEWFEKKNLFLYGDSGCGKSRILYEIIRKKIGEAENICVLNPSPLVKSNDILIGSMKLSQIGDICLENDILVWDNFPEALNSKDDIHITKNALSILTGVGCKCVLISLKPSYDARYHFVADNLSELCSTTVKYHSDDFRQILRIYGKSLFSDIYRRFIELQEEDILQMLLKREEPTPLTILSYYQSLERRAQTNQDIDPIALASELPGLLNYYKNQFNLLRKNEERKADVDFLCIFKLCHYYLKLPTTIDKLTFLQEKIFGSNLYDLERRLDTWIHLTGRYCGMPDVRQAAIEINIERKIAILDCLSNNLWNVIPDEGDIAFRTGSYLGSSLGSGGLLFEALRNFVVSDDQHSSYTKFIEGLGKGASYTFAFLDKKSQDQLLILARRHNRFAYYLGFGIGEHFNLLDRETQNRVLDMARQKLIVAYFLCDDLTVFGYATLDSILRRKVLELAKDDNLYAQKLGDNLGRIFMSLSAESQNEIWDLVEQVPLFAQHFGWTIGRQFYSLRDDIREKAWNIASQNESFAEGLGSIGYEFGDIDNDLRKQILVFAEKNDHFVAALGRSLGNTVPLLEHHLQEKILEILTQSKKFALQFYRSLGDNFALFDKPMQEKIFGLLKDDEYAYSLGISIGDRSFSHLKKEQQLDILERATKNSNLLAGLGHLLGFSYLEEDVQEKIWSLAEQNRKFALNLGYSFGGWFTQLNQSSQERVLTVAARNPNIAHRLGHLGFYLKDLSTEIQMQALKVVSTDNNYAYLLGKTIMAYGKFSDLEYDIQKEIMRVARDCTPFAMGLCESLGENSTLLKGSISDEVFDLIKRNTTIASSLDFGKGYSWVYYFSSGNTLTQDLEQMLYEIAKTKNYYAAGLGLSFGHWFNKRLSDTQQANAMEFASQNNFFAAGLGIAFRDHKEDMKDTALLDKINNLSTQNRCFAAAIRQQEIEDDDLVENKMPIISNIVQTYAKS